MKCNECNEIDYGLAKYDIFPVLGCLRSIPWQHVLNMSTKVKAMNIVHGQVVKHPLVNVDKAELLGETDDVF